MTGYQFYRYYLAIKLHFTTKKYDVFTNRDNVKVSIESFNKRHDKYKFDKFATKFPDEREAIRFLVANFAYGNQTAIWSDYDSSFNNLKLWIKNKESLSKIFSDDLDILNCTELLDGTIIKLWKCKKIHIETLAIISSLEHNLIETWLKNSSINLIYGTDLLVIEKLKPFIKLSDRIITEWNEFKSRNKKCIIN